MPVGFGTKVRTHSLMLGFIPKCYWRWQYQTNHSQDLTQLYQVHEQEKERAYNQRVLEVENGVFTPLVFSTSSGMEREISEFYKRLADYLSVKRNKPYSMTMG